MLNKFLLLKEIVEKE